MRRNISIMLCAVALAIGVAAATEGADATDLHGFSHSWCNAPVLIPIGDVGPNGVSADDGVVTSRGTEDVVADSGAVIRMNDRGSRVQFTFEETLFFTQFLFENIDQGAAIRVDASIGSSRQPVDASSVRGALVRAEEQSALGLTAVARPDRAGTGQVDLFVGATEVLFTNEGDTPIDIVGAIGCPAIELASQTVSAPAWDVDRQEFVAEYEIAFSNRLANPRTAALSIQESEASSVNIENLQIDVVLDSPGFSSARVGLLRLSTELERRRNIGFDGVEDVALLDTPLSLDGPDDQTIRLQVGFTPNFNDPAWAEGVAAPAPTVRVGGSVDGIAVGVAGRLSPDGVDLDPEAVATLAAPSPDLVLSHEMLGEPLSGPDGVVTTSERIEVENTGEAAISELVVNYSLIDLYGEGTQVLEINGRASSGCTGLFPEGFTGVGATVVLFDADGLRAGGTCVVELEARVLPGIIPTSQGVQYSTAITATARSGARSVDDVTSVRTEIAQSSTAEIQIEATEATNLRDGSYRFEGEIIIENTGDQNLSSLASRIDLTNGRGEAAEPINAVFQTITGTEECGVGAVPARADSGALLSSGVQLPPGGECRLGYSMIVRPGSRLNNWMVSALATTTTPRGLPLELRTAEDLFVLEEAPEVRASVAIESVTNLQNGNYLLQVDTTLENTGDTPLIEAQTTLAADELFGARLVSQERIINTCAGVDGSNPLASAVPVESCVTREQLVVRPLGQLNDWFIEGSVTGRSTSQAEVSSDATSGEIVFAERPRVSSSVSILSTEKVDDENIRFRLLGDIENTGDIELRDLSARLDLDDIFNGAEVQIEQVGSAGLSIADRFDGVTIDQLLTRRDVLAAEESAQWDMTVVVATGTDPGPFDLVVEVQATSPSRAIVSSSTPAASQAIPIIGITERSFTSENNNDGTYSVEHVLAVENFGGIDLPAIAVSTDLATIFDGLIVGEVGRTSNCGAEVSIGDSCTTTQRATIRPGSASGPYSVATFVSAVDESGLGALVAPEAQEATSVPPVTFDEAPSIELSAEFDSVENLGDGTYGVSYSFGIRNNGDVPLYSVDTPDPIQATFGDSVVSNILAADTCSSISFGSPLAPNSACTQSHDVIIRPLGELGPWTVDYDVIGQSPSLTTVNASVDADELNFTESVGLTAEANREVVDNRGNGSYDLTWTLDVTNTSDVPLIEIVVEDQGVAYDRVRTGRTVQVDSCGLVSFSEPLAPGAVCRVVLDDVLVPGANLGPHETTTQITGRSPSQATAEATVEADPITLTERPVVALTTSVQSVEAVEIETFRVVTILEAQNDGDVRIDDLDLTLDLDEMFPDSVYRIDGVISDDLEINEEFGLQESTSILAPGQSLFVGQSATMILVLSVEPGEAPGPFVGDLALSGVSPALADSTAVIDAGIDLPSIATEVLMQSVDNNRDGSYTVTTSYAVENDGSADLEFVRLREDLTEIYAGAPARVLAIDSPDLTPIDLESEIRGDDLLEWGVGLASGDRAVVTSTVLVTPGNQLGPFQSAILASALSPAGTPVGQEQLGSEEIVFVEQPALLVEQRLNRRPEWNTTGSFDVTFGIDVTNDGDVELRGLQVREDLLSALGFNSRIIVRDVRSETLTVNSNFDGIGRPPVDVSDVEVDENGEVVVAEPAPVQRDIGDTRLLRGFDTLAAGSTATIEVDLTITPETRGVFNTRVVVAANTPAGTGVGSADDVIEATTLTRLSVQGELGLAKRTIGEPTVRADGSVGVTYELLVENVGPFPLSNVEVHDQLSQAFGVGSTFVTSRVRVDADSPCFGFASSSYDGGTIDPVLVSRVDLQPNEQCRIQYDAAVLPSDELPGPFRSSAFAIATDPFSGTVIDDSTDGTNTDPDGNQEPGDNDIATSVRVELPEPEVALSVEPLGSEPSDRDDWHRFGYRILLENAGSIDVDSTTLLAPLDDQWPFSYEVVSLESDSLLVNNGFDGDRDQNLLNRLNRLRAGTVAEVVVVIESAIPRDGSFTLDVGFDASSVIGSPVEVQAETVVIEVEGGGDSSLRSWFESMSVEEQRLIGLGAGVITLFVLLFIFRAVRRTRQILGTRPEVDETTINLRDTTELDLRDDVEPAKDESPQERPRVSRVSPTEPHYRPRRRRGHRRVDR